MSSTHEAIRIEELTKRFGKDFTALDGVSMTVRRGEVVGYLGPNGAGKTTTLKILTNLLTPTSGHAYINGMDVNHNPKEALKYIGALIEVPGTYGYLTPREMLLYFGKVYGMDRNDLEKRISEVLQRVRLTDWERKPTGSFSTGMHRRLSIAKAILHNPEILILDEPVIGLDPKGIREVRELIRELQSENVTVLLSSHLLQEVSETCDYVVFLDRGKIVTKGAVEDIMNQIKSNVANARFLRPLSKEGLNKIREIGLVSGVTATENGIRIYYDGDPKSGFRILSEMISKGFEVTSFAPEQPNLEDFYVSIMNDERGLK